MPDDLGFALMQLPFVAAFIWFALRMSNDFRKDAAERDKHWLEFLTAEREQRKQAMDQGMEEVHLMTEGMTKMTEALHALASSITNHNREAIERHEKLMKQTEKA